MIDPLYTWTTLINTGWIKWDQTNEIVDQNFWLVIDELVVPVSQADCPLPNLGYDSSPEPYSFNNLSDQINNTWIVSNAITVTWIWWPIPIWITGWEYNINSWAWTTSSGTVNSWDSIVVRVMSSVSNWTTTSVSLNVWCVIEEFRVTTRWWGGGALPSNTDVCCGPDNSWNLYDSICEASWQSLADYIDMYCPVPDPTPTPIPTPTPTPTPTLPSHPAPTPEPVIDDVEVVRPTTLPKTWVSRY